MQSGKIRIEPQTPDSEPRSSMGVRMPLDPQVPSSLHLKLLSPFMSTPLALAKPKAEIRCQESASDLLPLPKYLRSHLTRHRMKEQERERERLPKISLAINSGARKGS